LRCIEKDIKRTRTELAFFRSALEMEKCTDADYERLEN